MVFSQICIRKEAKCVEIHWLKIVLCLSWSWRNAKEKKNWSKFVRFQEIWIKNQNYSTNIKLCKLVWFLLVYFESIPLFFFALVNSLSHQQFQSVMWIISNSDANSIFIFLSSTEYPGRCFEPVTMKLLNPGQDLFLPIGCLRLTCLNNFAFAGAG